MEQAPERADFSDLSQAGFFGDHTARYEFAAHFVRGKRVIDAASGSGYGTVRLKFAGAASCLGVDVDAASVARVRQLYGSQGVEYVQGDCEVFDFGAHRPEVIVSFETIEHVRHPERFLDAVRRGLEPDGVFIVSCPNDEKLGPHNPYHLHSWNADAFRRLLADCFDDVVLLGEVLTPAAQTRYEFGRYLDDRLGVLWSQPWTRAWRAVRRLLGRPALGPRPVWSNFIPDQHDYWFVPSTGPEAMSLIAVCRAPHRAESGPREPSAAPLG